MEKGVHVHSASTGRSAQANQHHASRLVPTLSLLLVIFSSLTMTAATATVMVPGRPATTIASRGVPAAGPATTAPGIAPAVRPATVGTTYYVASVPAGDDAHTCQSPDQPCASIGMAMRDAASGDTIDIAGGTYTETLSITKNLTLRGVGVGQTIVEGGRQGPVVTVGVSATAAISGVTMQDGYIVAAGTTNAAGSRTRALLPSIIAWLSATRRSILLGAAAMATSRMVSPMVER